MHDSSRGHPISDPAIRSRQVADFKRVFGEVDPSIPLLLCAGNHDVGDRPSAANIEAYKYVGSGFMRINWCDQAVHPQLARGSGFTYCGLQGAF
jgi:hypothetical protein